MIESKSSNRIQQYMVDRAERKIISDKKNHIKAYPLMGSAALILSGQRPRVAYPAIQDAILSRLTSSDVEAEIYACRYDMGNGYQDGRDQIRVIARSGEEQNEPHRMAIGPSDKLVVRADNKMIDNSTEEK